MTKEEFKNRWESSADYGGITCREIEDCAIEWGVRENPRVLPYHVIRYLVLKAANTWDCEDFWPYKD